MLHVDHLRVRIRQPLAPIYPVEDATLDVTAGQVVALVGESGSGKSLTALALMGLLPPAGAIAGGTLRFDGHDLLAGSAEQRRSLRGRRLAMVFQEPMSSLNPVLPVGRQVAESLVWHRGLSWRAAERKAVRMLARVGLPAPQRRARQYPHQLSGGMRQRVMIASALICEPDLLIADEPTTALDVTIQAQILDLLDQLQVRAGKSVLFITHDLSLVASFADWVHVMYAGRIVESAATPDLFAHPQHPYTAALLANIPRLDRPPASRRLPVIPGEVPRPHDRPAGCAFHPRCPHAANDARCRTEIPPLVSVGRSHVACWQPRDQHGV